jgi:hypothetical protein
MRPADAVATASPQPGLGRGVAAAGTSNQLGRVPGGQAIFLAGGPTEGPSATLPPERIGS